MKRRHKVQHWNKPWAPNPLVAYAMDYHEQCEMFDETVCTETRSGLAYPATGEQRRAVNYNARRVRAALIQRVAVELGLEQRDAAKRLQEHISGTVREFEKMWLSRKPTAKEETR